MKVAFLWAWQQFYLLSLHKNDAQNVGGGEEWGKNLAWSEIYSIVWKRHKENPEKAKGDYFAMQHFNFILLRKVWYLPRAICEFCLEICCIDGFILGSIWVYIDHTQNWNGSSCKVM